MSFLILNFIRSASAVKYISTHFCVSGRSIIWRSDKCHFSSFPTRAETIKLLLSILMHIKAFLEYHEDGPKPTISRHSSYKDSITWLYVFSCLWEIQVAKLLWKCTTQSCKEERHLHNIVCTYCPAVLQAGHEHQRPLYLSFTMRT